jgi:hypothetical protein
LNRARMCMRICFDHLQSTSITVPVVFLSRRKISSNSKQAQGIFYRRLQKNFPQHVIN